ncbi:hypothetical protein ACFY00_16200 [Kitasatospora sp. NPDC001540]|uniref:hypothetical protein n=1 Tax=Kitasatospora sp. NPDC001540 TaxID=3364014 RepID=UPI0036C987CF
MLRKCWADAADEEGTPLAGARELAARSADWSSAYLDLSLAELFRSYGAPTGEGDAVDLDDFLEEAVPEGAVLAHLDALGAVSEAVAACTGDCWDGALRCLQTAALAARQRQGDPRLPGPGAELRRQREDLERVRAAGARGRGSVVAELRARTAADALGWRRATEQLDLLHD